MIVDDDERSARTVGDRIPLVVVVKVENLLSDTIVDTQVLTSIVETADILAGDGKAAAITRGKCRHVFHDESGLARAQICNRAAGEAELDSGDEVNAAQV